MGQLIMPPSLHTTKVGGKIITETINTPIEEVFRECKKCGKYDMLYRREIFPAEIGAFYGNYGSH